MQASTNILNRTFLCLENFILKFLLQGDTIKAGCNLVVHWGPKLLEGMELIMLSRATRVVDVHIVGEFCNESIKCDKKYALPESERLLKIFDERQSK